MNHEQLQQQCDRLKNWISMLSVLPGESAAGETRDEFWVKNFQFELAAVERRLSLKRMGKTVNALYGLTNKLRELNRCL